MNNDQSQGPDDETMRDEADVAALLPDPAWDRWFDSVRGDLHIQIERETKVQCSGLASVFEEVAQRDPSRVSQTMLDDVWRQAHAEDRMKAADPRVAALIVAAQKAAQRDAMRVRPVLRGLAKSEDARPFLRRRSLWSACIAVAAAVVVMIGVRQGVGISVLDSAGLGDFARQLAVDHHDDELQRNEALPRRVTHLRTDSPSADDHEASTTPNVTSSTLSSTDASVTGQTSTQVEIDATAQPSSESKALAEPSKKKAVHVSDRHDELVAWDESAQAAWRAGQRDEAQRLFRAIIRVDHQGNLAQAAYGDLFLLAREAGDLAQRRALWRAYLQRFANGRLADDARAGLCRTAPSSEIATCWQSYLRDFSAGAHRSEAEEQKSLR